MDALAPKVYLILIDLVEVLFSTTMLIAYFVKRDERCRDGDSVMNYYIPVSCCLGYLAMARGVIVWYLFVHRAKIG